MKVTVNAFGKDRTLFLREEKYGNGRVAIVAISDGEPWGTLTLNIPEVELADDEIIVKDYSENAAWVPQVIANLPKVFEQTGRFASSGYVNCPIYKMSLMR